MGTLGNLQPLPLSLSPFSTMPSLHNSLVPSPRENSPQRGMFSRGCCSLIIPWVFGACRHYPSLESQVKGGEVCQPGRDALFQLDQLPSSHYLTLARPGWFSSAGLPHVLTHLCDAGLASDSHLWDNPQVSRESMPWLGSPWPQWPGYFQFWSKCVVSGDLDMRKDTLFCRGFFLICCQPPTSHKLVESGLGWNSFQTKWDHTDTIFNG